MGCDLENRAGKPTELQLSVYAEAMFTTETTIDCLGKRDDVCDAYDENYGNRGACDFLISQHAR